MRNIRVVDYDTQWPLMFEEEKEKFEQIFGDELTAVHHIGSTSVPGLKAKPVIDIMPVVKSIDAVDSCNDALQDIGYEALGEYGIPGRRYFRKGGDDRTRNIHFFEAGSDHIKRHLSFRDYLRNHEEVCKQYGDLKSQLADRFPHDIGGYMEGKDKFIKETERIAIRWCEDDFSI
ncbi:GrpB family protein [Salinicoccus halitifaciens]|uniref:GrpB-like predicted nucleotidyltransferase (UPF0157 family) n=1 Tax=Salinicoccus halitifaciens TaxID=1073415 RepID=A0ABV2ECZ1_9STAP|nr:GrpB family protein [Salinicoccus halitifaciens]MCD2138086.1 GrpB family protein [Salinicoccus halitifaciens]